MEHHSAFGQRSRRHREHVRSNREGDDVRRGANVGLAERIGTGVRDKGIALFAIAAIVASACAFSCAPAWGLRVVFGCSLAAVAVLFFPLRFLGLDKAGRSRGVPECLRHLIRFPLFWLGALLLGYILIQGLNPGWGVTIRTFYWTVYPVPHVDWLPFGIDAPFDLDTPPNGMNAFRQLMMFGSPWLLLCALWSGVRHRRTYAAIGWGALLCAVVLGAWGGEMRITQAGSLLGVYDLRDTSFFATFLYQNHAAAWLSLQFALAVALGLWHWDEASRRRAGSGPHLVCAAFASWIVLATILTFSFGGILTVGIMLFVVTPVALLWGLARRRANRGILIGGAVASVLLVSLFLVFFATTDFSYIEGKIARKFQLAQTNSLDDREPLRCATWKMFEARDGKYSRFGYGAGSYRWISPGFFRQVPEFVDARTGRLTARANNAHCDWLQMLVEWGYVGFSIVALGFVSMLTWFLARVRTWSPPVFVLLCSFVLFSAHAAMDFLNYCVPLLVLLAFLVAFAGRLVLGVKEGRRI